MKKSDVTCPDQEFNRSFERLMGFELTSRENMKTELFLKSLLQSLLFSDDNIN